jgi:hypothetical protein
MSGEQPKQFDIINKAKHYNLHPSGIECIELAERLSFCAGNAFKYVFRRGDKGNTLQDLEKAVYYLDRERKQMEHLIRWRTHHEVDTMLVNDHFTPTDLANIRKLLDSEPNKFACAIYSRIFGSSVKISRYIEDMRNAVEYVQGILQPQPEPLPDPNTSFATTAFYAGSMPGMVRPDGQ